MNASKSLFAGDAIDAPKSSTFQGERWYV